MGLKRLFFFVVLAAAMSLGLASSAPAGNFDEERMGCLGDSPAVCPAGTTGTPYSLRFLLQGDEDTGCAVLSVSSGSLPFGLSITQQFNETKAAIVSGTPTQPGTYEFYATVPTTRRRAARSRPRTTASASRSTRGSRSSRSGLRRHLRARWDSRTRSR